MCIGFIEEDIEKMDRNQMAIELTKMAMKMMGEGAPDSLTAGNVISILAEQPGNAGKTRKRLSRWVVSDNFTLMTIPVTSVGIATTAKGKSRSSNPIIVDVNVNQVGGQLQSDGKPPVVLVIDGKHRLSEAIARGETEIRAYVGDKAMPYITGGN